MANTIHFDLRSTVDFIVASTETLDSLLQINIQQCKLLAKKASESVHVLRRFQESVLHNQGQENISWTCAATELYRVLKDAKILISDCSDDQWLKVILKRGNMNEAFQGLLYNIQLHISMLNSTLITERKCVIFEKNICDGNLDAAEFSSLSAAAKQDQDRLVDLLKCLKGDHVCDGESCMQDSENQQCLAARYLDKMDGEELVLADRKNLSASNPFMSAYPRDFSGKGRFLGRGSFGTVKEKIWMGEKYAMKKFIGESSAPFFEKEIAALAGLNHPNIVHVVSCYKKDEYSFGILMELMYKSLYDLLKDHRTCSTSGTTPFSIIQAVVLMLQIGEGVKYIHSRSLVHYDLKSLNILVQFADPDRNTIPLDMDFSNVPFIPKICDFGLTTIKNASTGYSHQTPNKGSPSWMAPELFIEEPRPTGRVQPMKVDVYSFGIVCYEILSGKEPYADLIHLKARVKKGERPELPKETPSRLAYLIKHCWNSDPRQRPNFSAICEELRYIKGLLIRGDIITLEQNRIPVSTSYLEAAKMFIETMGLRFWNSLQGKKDAKVVKQSISMNGEDRERLRTGPGSDARQTAQNELCSQGLVTNAIGTSDRTVNSSIDLKSRHFQLQESGLRKYNDTNYEEALADLDTACSIEASNATTLSIRGAVKVKLNDFEKALKDLDKANELDSNNCFIKIQRGEAKRSLRDFEGALVDLNDGNALAPNHVTILAQRGDVKLSLGDFVGALEDLNRADELNSNDAFIYQQRGVVMYERKDLEGALTNFSIAHKLMPMNDYTLCCRGMTKRDLLDYEGSLADLNMAYNIQPQCVLTLQNRGDVKRILCRYEEALQDLILADQIQPNNVFTLSVRGAVYKELKNFREALKDLDQANALDNDNAFIKIQRGQVKRRLKDFEAALVDFNNANDLVPDHGIILAERVAVKLELLKVEEALADLNKAHELRPDEGFIYQQRGIVQRELGNLVGALNDLNVATAILPKDPNNFLCRGVMKRELLDYKGSLEDLNMANTLEPYNDFTLSERGVTEKVLRDFQGALQDLTMANHIKPDQAFTLKHRGNARRELGDIDEALQDLSYADILEPDDFFTLLELGKTKNLSHDYAGALVHYNRVVEMEPTDPRILRQRGCLKRMLGDYSGALEDFNKVDELQRPISVHNNDVPIMMERCFTKYAMKDVAGALEDAMVVRNLWGVNGQSLVKGERLELATTQNAPGPPESASSMSQKLCDIEKSTSCHRILWIDHSKLVFSKSLGRGSFGYVHKCKWVDKNKDVAVKYISSHLKDAFEYEARMLANIRHPRVVRFIGCSYDEEEEQGLLVMELMHQNLRSLINSKRRENSPPFDLPVAVDIMDQIAEAMAYLHDQGILHRDLKSSNILVNKSVDGKEDYVVKIADFGSAKLLHKGNYMPYFMTVDVGATLWRAPEVFKSGHGCHKTYSFPADVWSYAITCYEILTGEVPFEGITCTQIRQKILRGLRPELPASCPSILKSLVTKCWSLMPYDRPTFANIHKTLKLYLGRDSIDRKAGDVIGPHELRRLC
ncbi:hypothetical protein M758_1G286800 [Ceratodon purpureus]|nr:hypothetical protein M758_1G286800 [Ceratodon purpureus]